ncbi:MAG: MoxR family ATPase [Chloroflexi bacterium]|nr:MoxR family ATPase [Chloroflexota bacterium]MBP8057273.1 MoxR family ATPase [Chloroflexota bacterium]
MIQTWKRWCVTWKNNWRLKVSNSVNRVAELSGRVVQEVEKAIIGKRNLLRMVMAAILADGHVLLEDFPGLGKTLLANSFATALGISFKRIQFTPDLLPGDITGGYIFNRATSEFELRKGPIFANIVLADEINRASPKTQSALLEAMQEHQVTIEGETMRLPDPFIVLATQNPIEYEGTFPLPEAQLDRFIMKLSVGYPSAEEEQAILRSRRQRKQDAFNLQAVTQDNELLAMRQIVEEVYVDDDIEKYIVSLVTATRQDTRVVVGSSPRGSLALLKLARAFAAMDSRTYLLPDDVKQFAVSGLSHRLILEPDLWTRRNAAEGIVQGMLGTVAVPVIKGI